MWLEPDEWQGNAEPEQLQVLSAHPAHRLHSQLNYSSLRELYAVANREPVTIHPDDAQTRGIQDGDTVRCGTHAGKFLPARSLARELNWRDLYSRRRMAGFGFNRWRHL